MEKLKNLQSEQNKVSLEKEELKKQVFEAQDKLRKEEEEKA